MPTATATTANPCGCCGDTPPPPTFECGCALFIAGDPDTNAYRVQAEALDSPAPDYATAQQLIADYTAGCIAFFPGNLGGAAPITSKSASFDSGTEILSSSESVGPAANTSLSISTAVTHSVALKAGALVSVDYNCVSTGSGTVITSVLLIVSRCDQSEVIEVVVLDASDFGYAATQAGTIATTIPIPDDNEYIIQLLCLAGPASEGAAISTLTSTYDASSDDTMTVNPVIALWDNSGTTRKLWACPKLLLPPLTEDTGDWYADCAAADAVLTSDQVSNCVGFDEINRVALDVFTFSATGGSTLSLSHFAQPFVGPPGGVVPMNAWGGFNAVDGDVITVSWSASGSAGTGQSATAWLYDDTGALIETVSNNTGADLVFSALSYTGRYTIRIQAGVEIITDIFGDITASAVVSSSGTMTTNPIQALYDIGLGCPARLDCGDSCP